MAALSRRMALVATGASLLPLLGIAVARLFFEIRIPNVTRDVAAIAEIHPLSGLLSSMGILLWWTSASVWLFAAVLGRAGPSSTDPGFFVYSGLLSAYLGLDDLFQIHEYLAPTYLNVPERGVYGLFAAATAVYLWRYRRLLQRPDGVLLLCALACLSGSVAVDTVLEPWLWRLKDWLFFVEDGLKWVGICFWTAFCIARCCSELRPLVAVHR